MFCFDCLLVQSDPALRLKLAACARIPLALEADTRYGPRGGEGLGGHISMRSGTGAKCRPAPAGERCWVVRGRGTGLHTARRHPPKKTTTDIIAKVICCTPPTAYLDGERAVCRPPSAFGVGVGFGHLGQVAVKAMFRMGTGKQTGTLTSRCAWINTSVFLRSNSSRCSSAAL